MLLWSGSLSHKDHALQLVLIVDYIVDWARDIYRPSILRQFKSIATGKPFDQVSIADSNIPSISGNIPTEIPPPPSPIIEVEDDGIDIDNGPFGPNGDLAKLRLSHFDFLQLEYIDVRFGSIRSALLSNWRFVSLRLSERSVPDLLRLTAQRFGGRAGVIVQQIVKFTLRIDNVLVLRGSDLDELEVAWTGTANPSNNTKDPEEASEEYYVVMEAACYFDRMWFIVRELSLLAVSKRAFHRLVNLYGELLGDPEVASLPERARVCPSHVLSSCIKCLRSGTPRQVLLSAISCTLLAIHPLPERSRAEPARPVRVLCFGYLRDSRVGSFIKKWLGLDLETLSKESEVPFKRMSNSRTCIISEEIHSRLRCERCSQNSESETSHLGPGFFDMRIPPVISGDLVLIISLSKNESMHMHSHDVEIDACAFALNLRTGSESKHDIPLAVQALIHERLVYHTARRSFFSNSSLGESIISHEESIIWNLPLPYRPMTESEWFHVLRFTCGLHDHRSPPRPDNLQNDTWDETQMLLYYLSIGHSFITAKSAIASFVSKSKAENRPSTLEALRKAVEGSTQGQDSRSRWKLKGDEVARAFFSWTEGEVHFKSFVEGLRSRTDEETG